MKKDYLTELVRARLTKEDRELMEQYATTMRMSISDYIRYCCLTKPPKEVQEHEQRRS